MKTQLTNEGKARFFAHNMGARFYTKFYTKYCSGEALLINGATILNIQAEDELFETATIILTPLSLITDEDAIEVLKLRQQFEKGDEILSVKIEHRTKDGFTFICGYEKWADSRQGYVLKGKHPFSVFQYLQSKGYALSHYCQIAKRIVTVEEQVEAGWITLKTN